MVNLPFLGILQLDTQFPRVLGDAGNVKSYAYPAETLIVEQADVPLIVNAHAPDAALQQAFIEAAQTLEARGAFAIISTCGFLVRLQSVIASSVSIPVCLSALSDAQRVLNLKGQGRLGIMTASASTLTADLLLSVGINPHGVSIVGLEDCEAFSSVILRGKNEQLQTLDQSAIEAACIQKADALIEAEPDITAILLECGNLPPYADAIQRAVQRPVYSILDVANRFYQNEAVVATD